MGMAVMDSTPPAAMISACPVMIMLAAVEMAWRPEAQKRLTVCPGTSQPSPARKAITRAILKPWTPSGLAQPTIRSSIWSRASWGIFFSTPSSTWPA